MSAIFVSSTARPIALQMRRDLVVRRQRWQGREYWTVKDPLTLKYFRFENEEFAILSMLDGQTSSDCVRERFELEFAPQRISAAPFTSIKGSGREDISAMVPPRLLFG